MKPTAGFAMAIALGALATTSPLHAQTAPSGEAQSLALAEIADALGRIADAMERQIEGSRLDLLMKRVDISHSRLNELEGRLRAAQTDYDKAVENQTRLESQLETLQERAEAEGADENSMRFNLRQLETELELAGERVANPLATITRLQHEIATRHREIEDWQAYVDREINDL